MRRLLILLLLVSLCMADNAASQFQSQTSSFTMDGNCSFIIDSGTFPTRKPGRVTTL